LTRHGGASIVAGMDPNPLEKAAQIIEGGMAGIGRLCGLEREAVRLWVKKGCLPRTDHTGETSYSATIAAATGDQVTRDDLLAWSREGYARKSAA
jgi:hypothetical protein